jgi:hypothetical protein
VDAEHSYTKSKRVIREPNDTTVKYSANLMDLFSCVLVFRLLPTYIKEEKQLKNSDLLLKQKKVGRSRTSTSMIGPTKTLDIEKPLK